MTQVQDMMLLVVMAASSAMGEIAVHSKAVGSPQSAAAPLSSKGAAKLESIGAARPAGWELFEEAAKSLKKSEKGTISVAQIRGALTSLSERLGNTVAQGPVGIENWITQNLLPQATQTKNEMQHEVDAAKAKVEDCGSLMWSAEKEVEHREKILLEDESGEYQCIAMEHQLHQVELDRCNDQLTFQRNLQPPPSINNVSKNPQAMKDALTKNFNYYNQAFPEFMNRKQACDDATSAAEAQLAECDADEAVIEQFYCKMKYGRDQACASYVQCYNDQLANLGAIIKKVEALEQHVKDQFQTMACMGNSFSDAAANASQCDTDAYSTNHLDVNYPSDPKQEICVSLMNTRRNYSLIVCDGETVVSGPASSGGSAAGPAAAGGNNTGAVGGGNATVAGNSSF